MKIWKGLPGIGVMALGTGNLALAQERDEPVSRALQALTLHDDSGLGWHEAVLAVGAVTFLAVFAIMFYSVLSHRRSGERGEVAFRQSLGVEFIWCLLPFVIAVAMAWPAASAALAMAGAGGPALHLEVQSEAGQWRYRYDDGVAAGLPPASARPGPLTAPADTVLRLSWRTAPACQRQVWFRAEAPGRYRIPSGDLCPGAPAWVEVHALPEEAFSAWAASQRRTPP